MEFIKKQSIGVWATLIALILAIAGLVTYNSNISSEGYFQGASVAAASSDAVIAIVLLVIAIVAAQLSFDGLAGKIVDAAASVLRILAPALLVAAAMLILGARVEGIGYVLYSNAEVLAEIQTEANLASVNGAITSVVVLAVAGVAAMFAAFFGLQKKAK